jgi:Protein of unknown function (DUF3309)
MALRATDDSCRRPAMGTLLLTVLIIGMLGTVPSHQHSRSWGYGPSGFIGLLLVILIYMMVLGWVPWTGWTWGVSPVAR